MVKGCGFKSQPLFFSEGCLTQDYADYTDLFDWIILDF